MKITSIAVAFNRASAPDCYHATVFGVDEGEEFSCKASAEAPHLAVRSAVRNLGWDLLELRAKGFKVDVQMELRQ